MFRAQGSEVHHHSTQSLLICKVSGSDTQGHIIIKAINWNK
jgi:hypothetical protein